MNDKPVYVYRHGNGIYMNLTNRCPNACAFCIKNKWAMRYEGSNLNLEQREPSAAEVLALIKKELEKGPAAEYVFCGYGEPTYALPVMTDIAKSLKEQMASGELPRAGIRLNTIGLGSMIWEKNIVPELAENIDEIFISLNAQDKKTWQKLVRPQDNFKDGFNEVLAFIKEASGRFKRVVVSMVGKQGADEEKTRALAESLGAEFKLRAPLDD
jgi:TatD family-associated radical SAM protein